MCWSFGMARSTMQFFDQASRLKMDRVTKQTCPVLGLGVWDWNNSGQDAGTVWCPGLAHPAAETKLADGVVFVAVQPIQMGAEHGQQEAKRDGEKGPEQNARAALEEFQDVNEFPAHKPKISSKRPNLIHGESGLFQQTLRAVAREAVIIVRHLVLFPHGGDDDHQLAAGL